LIEKSLASKIDFLQLMCCLSLQFEKLGYSRPLINLPVSLVYTAGSLTFFLPLFF